MESIDRFSEQKTFFLCLGGALLRELLRAVFVVCHVICWNQSIDSREKRCLVPGGPPTLEELLLQAVFVTRVIRHGIDRSIFRKKALLAPGGPLC